MDKEQHFPCTSTMGFGMVYLYEPEWLRRIMPILQYMDSKNQIDSKPVNVLIAFDHHFLNGCTIQLFSKLGRLKGVLHSNFIIDVLANRHPTEDEIKRSAERSDFIITKTGFQGPDFTNTYNHLVTQHTSKLSPMKTFVMTDGSTVSLYAGKALKR